MSRMSTDCPRQEGARWALITKERVHHVSTHCWVKYHKHGHGENILLSQMPKMTLLTAGEPILHS